MAKDTEMNSTEKQDRRKNYTFKTDKVIFIIDKERLQIHGRKTMNYTNEKCDDIFLFLS